MAVEEKTQETKKAPKEFRPKIRFSPKLKDNNLIRPGSVVDTKRDADRVVDSFSRNTHNVEITSKMIKMLPLYYARKYNLWTWVILSKADLNRVMKMTIQEVSVLQREILAEANN